jgi:hypothetical protein
MKIGAQYLNSSTFCWRWEQIHSRFLNFLDFNKSTKLILKVFFYSTGMSIDQYLQKKHGSKASKYGMTVAAFMAAKQAKRMTKYGHGGKPKKFKKKSKHYSHSSSSSSSSSSSDSD